MVLMEVIKNRVKKNNVVSIMMKILSNWQWEENYDEAPGRRIWVV